MPVTIATADGKKTVRVNERKAPSIDEAFVSLGEYSLSEQTTITITNTDTDGYVVVDAVRLLVKD